MPKPKREENTGAKTETFFDPEEGKKFREHEKKKRALKIRAIKKSIETKLSERVPGKLNSYCDSFRGLRFEI